MYVAGLDIPPFLVQWVCVSFDLPCVAVLWTLPPFPLPRLFPALAKARFFPFDPLAQRFPPCGQSDGFPLLFFS